MTSLSQIAPKEKLRLMDLAEAAGVDVSDWANFQGGKTYAARNPKYCYEWCFVEDGKVVVLNIWHHALKENSEGITTNDFSMREFASQRPEPERTRGLKMDSAIQTAIKDKLPIRVILLAGKRRGDPDGPVTGPSKVSKRLLDPETWGVSSYDESTGKFVLKRGLKSHALMKHGNEFPDVDASVLEATEGRKKWVQHFQRERDRRIIEAKKQQVLKDKGKLICEACDFDFTEFYQPHAVNFCEVHHRKPVAELKEGEKTTLRDLAILCSNCHRVIHSIKPMPKVEEFRAMLKSVNGVLAKSQNCAASARG